MRIGAFEVREPIPRLRNPHVIATLSPWVDAGNVGTRALAMLMDSVKAQELGRLARPGRFFDFTRYRPTTHYVRDHRILTVPNSTISYAQLSEELDMLFFNVLEPHAFAEEYIEAISELLVALGVKRYCRLGAWYGAVPHTRRLQVGYTVDGQRLDLRTGRRLERTRRYEGPTSVMGLLNVELEKRGIENVSLMVQLPYYARIEEDYSGVAVVLEALHEISNLSSEVSETIARCKSRGERQYRELSAMMADNPDVSDMIQRLEAAYDAEEDSASILEDSAALSPEIERFLREITDQLESGDFDV